MQMPDGAEKAAILVNATTDDMPVKSRYGVVRITSARS